LPESTGEPPRRLVGWAKVELAPGETREITVTLDPNATAHPLSYWNVKTHGWETAAGDYHVYVGASSRDIRLTGTVRVHREEYSHTDNLRNVPDVQNEKEKEGNPFLRVYFIGVF